MSVRVGLRQGIEPGNRGLLFRWRDGSGDEEEAGGEITQHLGAGAAMAPVVGADERAEEGVEAIFGILGPGGLEQFLNRIRRGKIGKPTRQEMPEQLLVAGEFLATSGHGWALVLDDLIEAEPTDHGRVRIDFRRLPVGLQIPTGVETQFREPGEDPRWTLAKREVGGMTSGMEASELTLGDAVDGPRTGAIGADDGGVDGDEGGAGIGEAPFQPFDQRVIAGADPTSIDPGTGGLGDLEEGDAIGLSGTPGEIESDDAGIGRAEEGCGHGGRRELDQIPRARAWFW